MAHPTRFERVTFAFGGQALTGQATASNSNLRWLHVPDLNPLLPLTGLNLGRYLDRPVPRSLFLHGDAICAAAWRR